MSKLFASQVKERGSPQANNTAQNCITKPSLRKYAFMSEEQFLSITRADIIIMIAKCSHITIEIRALLPKLYPNEDIFLVELYML